MSADVLPDGRVDHRNHEREDQGGVGWECASCSTEEVPVDWTIPYDVQGRPIPKNWRERPYAEVAALCGMPLDAAAVEPDKRPGEVGTGAGEGATGQDTGTAWVTRSEDCPEAPAQAHLPEPDTADLARAHLGRDA